MVAVLFETNRKNNQRNDTGPPSGCINRLPYALLSIFPVFFFSYFGNNAGGCLYDHLKKGRKGRRGGRKEGRKEGRKNGWMEGGKEGQKEERTNGRRERRKEDIC